MRLAVMGHDLTMVGVSWSLAYLLRYDFAPPGWLGNLLAWTIPVAMVVYGFCFRFFGMYAGIWRYASIPDLMRIVRAVAVGTMIVGLFFFLAVRAENIPRSVIVLHPLVLVLLLGLPRVTNRLLKARNDRISNHNSDRRPILVVGAGDAAELLLRDSLLPGGTFRVVAFVDDDAQKQGLKIHEVPVLGRIADIQSVIAALDDEGQKPTESIIAIPSASAEVMRKIVEQCERTSLPFRIVPRLDDIVTGRVAIGQLREVTIEDILGRESVHLNETAVAELVSGKRIMVTGGGGSIGSELVRQIARFNPAMIILYEQSEYNLYQIDRNLARIFPEVLRQPILGDTRDANKVTSAIRTYRPDIVMHAAAYKHVPLVEMNPIEGVMTNVMGTRTVAHACVALGVPRFVMVSTDKAVNPVNVMGASKRLAEVYCQNLQAMGATAFITVRFGNVLGSVGSVVPLFREQIRRGGPVTVTHPDMQRYFMTIPEACQLILQATAIGAGGEIFVLDMGRPVKIADLARDMIHLSGKEVGRDIEIVYTGLRPGEKLFEELRYDDEEVASAGHEKIFLCRPTRVELEWLDAKMDRLLECCESQDIGKARQLLQQMVPEYKPAEAGAPAPQRSASDDDAHPRDLAVGTLH